MCVFRTLQKNNPVNCGLSQKVDIGLQQECYFQNSKLSHLNITIFLNMKIPKR